MGSVVLPGMPKLWSQSQIKGGESTRSYVCACDVWGIAELRCKGGRFPKKHRWVDQGSSVMMCGANALLCHMNDSVGASALQRVDTWLWLWL